MSVQTPDSRKYLLDAGWHTVLLALLLGMAACSQDPIKENSSGHIGLEAEPATSIPDIPQPVTRAPVLPPPVAEAQLETYTVIVNEVPVKELLFALARDAKLNLDIYDDISGVITINAIDQTLPQILDRIAKRTSIRYQIENNNLIVAADTPYLRTYRVDYINMSRQSDGQVDISTQISSAGSTDVGQSGSGSRSGNNSVLAVKNISAHDFWRSLFTNITSILGEKVTGNTDLATPNVMVNREAGLISVRATSKQQASVQEFIDAVIASVQRQVLIEATIAEVTLSDRYQAGVDWSRVTTNLVNGLPDGINIEQQLTGGNLSAPPTFLLQYGDLDDDVVVSSSVRLLSQFGNVKVLSSPKIMALNNQTSVLKVVDNRVYFTLDVQSTTSENFIDRTVESNIHTVPVGFVMSLVPFISETDEVMLNIRPTISRILRFVEDPNPALADNDVTSSIPEIQVREMESMLRINDGQIAVIGGLMQDSINDDTDAVPGLSRIPIIGAAFKYRDKQINKTELVIFLRATIIKEPGLDGDLKNFKPFLPTRTPKSS